MNKFKVAARCKSCNTEIDRTLHMKDYRIGDAAIMLAAQKRLCAICKAVPGKISHAVDHCHRTGAIRGMLCRICNTTLGHYESGWRPAGNIPAFDAYLQSAAAATAALLQEHRK